MHYIFGFSYFIQGGSKSEHNLYTVHANRPNATSKKVHEMSQYQRERNCVMYMGLYSEA